MAHDNSSSTPQKSEEAKRFWWNLPFDATTNFSLLGFILGGLHWEGNEEKKVNFTLNEKK